MFVAHYENTTPDQKPRRVNLHSEMVRQKRDEALALRNQDERIARATERLKQQVAEANDAIAWANKRITLLSFADILTRISKATGVSAADILSPRRGSRAVFARQAVAYWCCRMTTLSLPQIGRRMKRDHTSIVHARRVYVEKRQAMGRSLRCLDNRYGPGGQPVRGAQAE